MDKSMRNKVVYVLPKVGKTEGRICCLKNENKHYFSELLQVYLYAIILL